MPDPTLSEALREAYASAPAGQVILHTLEIWHPVFAAPIRVVRARAGLEARLEATAPRNPGEVVSFTAWAFDLVPPEQDSAALPQVEITIDNVARDIQTHLDAAAMAGDAVSVIWRQFLSDDLDGGPAADPPLELTLMDASATDLQIRATLGFPRLMDQEFPSLDYDAETFPGLVE